MKKLLTILLLLNVAVLQSQNLDQFIPRDALAVVELSSDQIFNLIDHKTLGALLPPDPTGGPMDLDQYGIDLNAKAYYFYTEKDSISYQNVIVPLSNMLQLEEYATSMFGTTPTQVSGYSVIMEGGSVSAWNSSMAVFSSATIPKKVYTIEDIKAEKEKEKEMNNQTDEESGEETEGEESYGTDEYQEEDDSMLQYELMMKNMEAPYLMSDDEILEMMNGHFSSIINVSPAQSITRDPSYTKNRDNKSSIYFWVKNVDELFMGAMLGELEQFFPGSTADNSPKSFMGMQALKGNLIFDRDEIRMDVKMGVTPKLAAIYKKAYSSKIDKSFLNHFNQSDMLGYMSFTSDMAEMLKSYPDMVDASYGSWLPQYRNEMNLAMDLFSIVIDEEAIGELITGDGLMILHDFEGQEVTYKTTEYDDDLNAIEVEKTKIEQIPTFSFMLGSENEKFMRKAMRVAERRELVTNQGKFYKIPSKEMGAPFDVFFAYHDGIAFLTNSQGRAINYSLGKKSKNLGKHKNNLKNNIVNVYMDMTSTLGFFSDLVPPGAEAVHNFKEMYISSDAIKDNEMGYNIVIKTDGTKGNSLKMIIDSLLGPQGMP